MRIARDAMDNTHSLKGTITIGTVESMSDYRMESVFSDFLRRHPNVNLVIKNRNSRSLPRHLANDEFDVVFLYDCGNLSYEGFSQQMLFQEDLVFCVSPKHRLASKKEVCSADLKYETFLNFAENYDY